ncbi:MAG: DUF1294 domain-containing protein [Rariglobus sp.]
MSLPEGVALYYGVLSLITLVLYALDKRASKRPGARRVRERTLHLWALAGGFVGSLMGLFWLRHKTRHPSFAFVTVLALAIHAGAWVWWWRGAGG